MRLLLIEDDMVYFKVLSKALGDAGHELVHAKTGTEGLTFITSEPPDVLIMDLGLPDTDGFAILGRLRRNPQFNHIPVIVITVEADLSAKLKAFELGADDYLVKPFPPEELLARLQILSRRSQALKMLHGKAASTREPATTVVIHSLRGGSGCSSLAVNLGLAFYELWNKPTVLLDGVLAAGQVAMMLAVKPGLTWGSFINTSIYEVDDELLARLVMVHESGLSYIASPALPSAPDSFSKDFFKVVVEKLQMQNDFVIMDLAHDFSDLAIQMLNLATWILLVIGPEVSSLRAATGALDTYGKLGFPPDRIKLVLNNNTDKSGLKQSGMEKVLGRPMDFVLPYEPIEVLRAINLGVPFLLKKFDLPISAQIENMAFQLSNELDRNLPPPSPTPTWKRVNNRLGTGD